MQVATVLDDPGVWPIWSKHTAVVVPVVHVADTPQTQTLLRQRLDKTSPPHGSDVPHLQELRPTQVSVVNVHAGLHNAEKRGPHYFCCILLFPLPYFRLTY